MINEQQLLGKIDQRLQVMVENKLATLSAEFENPLLQFQEQCMNSIRYKEAVSGSNLFLQHGTVNNPGASYTALCGKQCKDRFTQSKKVVSKSQHVQTDS